jgi:hypothetical protein
LLTEQDEHIKRLRLRVQQLTSENSRLISGAPPITASTGKLNELRKLAESPDSKIARTDVLWLIDRLAEAQKLAGETIDGLWQGWLKTVTEE